MAEQPWNERVFLRTLKSPHDMYHIHHGELFLLLVTASNAIQHFSHYKLIFSNAFAGTSFSGTSLQPFPCKPFA